MTSENTKSADVPRFRFPEFEGAWKQLKLGEVGPVSMCKRIFSHETSTSGDVPFYKIGTFGREPDSYIPVELYERYKCQYSYPKIGEILISAAGTIGRLVIFDGRPAYFQDSNIVWVANDETKVKNSFLFRCYEKTIWTTENTTIARLYNDNLKSIKLILPSLSEQKKIAAFLGVVDEKIVGLRAKVEGLETYKRGLMQALFSQRSRFTKPDGTAFPDWEEKKLGEDIKVFSGGTPTAGAARFYGGSIPFIKSGEISNFETEQFLTDEGLKSSSAKIVEKGELLYALYGATSGEVGISKLAGAINQAVLCIRTNQSKMFLFHWLKFNKDEICSTFLQGGQGNLSADIVKSLKIKLPNPVEQQKIAYALSAMDAKIQAASSQVLQMEKFKKGLLQQMFV